MRTRAGPGITLFLVLIIGICLPGLAYPRGRAEKEAQARLAEVERLIEARQYNAAILMLSELVKQNPDLFDAAEALMNRIRAVRSQYNAKYEQMIKALFEENDIAKGLELIEELQQLDPYPNEAVAKSLDRAKTAKELVFNLARFNEIMEEAAVLLAQDKFVEASLKYAEGFSLSRQSFDATEYGNIIKNSVYASLDSLNQAVQGFVLRMGEVSQAEGAFDEAKLAQQVPVIVETLRQIALQRVAAEQAGANFRIQSQRIRERGAGPSYEYFLFFLIQLAAGRSAAEREGIAGAIARAWESSFDSVQRRLLASGDASWKTAMQELGAERYPEAEAALAKTSSIYSATLELLALWPLRLSASSLRRMDTQAASVLRGGIPVFLLAQQRIKEARDYRSLIELSRSFGAVEQEGVPRLESIPEARRRLAEMQKQTDELGAAWRVQANRYRELARQGYYELKTHLEQAETIVSAADALGKRITALDISYTYTAGGDSLRRIIGAASGYQARLEEAKNLQEGISVALKPVTDEKGNVIATPVRLEKYPGRALGILKSLESDSKARTAEAEKLSKDLLRDSAYLQASKSLQELEQELGELTRFLASLQAEVAQRMQGAEASLLQAERYKQEGLLRVQQAKTNLSAERYDVALESVQAAGEALDTSLSFQEDPEVRRIRDETLPQLSRDITDGLNKRVVREVRSLINEGRQQFTLQKYVEAEIAFQNAKARWEKSHPEENKEISDWLDWTRRAILNVTGRQIALADPLYTEMSQLYNLVYQDYQKAKRLTEEGRAREALEVLERPKDPQNNVEARIQQILFFFPYNTDTRILSLRVAQLRDREGFPAVLRNMYNEALKLRDEEKYQEALNALEVLRAISPNYPGLQSAVGSLRIRLGLQLAPPDPAKIAEAKRLYAEALRIYQQNLRDLFPVALETLSRAIGLDPNNAEATSLKDRIHLATGGTSQVLISSDDQQRFKNAEREFLNGNYLGSLQIVNDLLKTRRNQGYPPLLDLKKRIEAKL